MGAAAGDPRRNRWRSRRRSSAIPSAPAYLGERRRRPEGGGLRLATAPGTAGCRCGGWNHCYPLPLISQGQVLPPLSLPCYVSSRNTGKDKLWGLFCSGQPPSNAPPARLEVGRPPAGWAMRRGGDRDSLGKELRSPRLCISLYPPRPTHPLWPSCPLHSHGFQYRLQTDGLQT